jgi:hypothetical protein
MINRIGADNPNQGEPGGEPICIERLVEVYYSMKSILSMYEGIIINCTKIPYEHKQTLFKMSRSAIADFDYAITDLEKIIDEE